MDYQVHPQYNLSLLVINTNLPPQTTTFSLVVKLSNEAGQPYYTNMPNTIVLSEGLTTAGNIFTPICIDPDGSTLTYETTVLPPEVANQLALSSTTGVVSTKTSTNLNYAETPALYMAIYCHNGVYTVSSTLTIQVQQRIATTATTTTTAAPATSTTQATSSGLTGTRK